MGDTTNANETDEKEVVENLGDEQDTNKNTSGTDGEGEETDTSEDDNTDKGDEVEEGESDKKDKPESKPTPKTADDEPKTRKRNIDFILERKDRKIAKLSEKANNADHEEEDDIDNDDAEIIDKRIQKALTPFVSKQMQEEDQQEIATFIAQNPDFAPYADKVKKFAQHPSRKEMPIQSIFYEVAGPDLLKIGADRARKSLAESRKSNAGGGSGTKGAEGPKNVWDLSPEEFEKQQQEVRSRQRE